jgi:hypothetical protein
MKKTFLITLLLVFGLIAGCDSDLPTTAEKPLNNTETEGLTAEIRGFGVSAETGPVYTFADMEEVGTSKLVRTENQLGVKLHTTGLVHNQVMTLWWVIFNNPGQCSDTPCGMPDLFDADVQPACLYADGDIVSGNGNSRYQDRLDIGDERDSCLDFFGGEDYGLLNPEGAEVHFVVRSHGPLIPGQVPEMRSTFAGGCEENLDQGITPENPGECSDLQFAVYLAPDDE